MHEKQLQQQRDEAYHLAMASAGAYDVGLDRDERLLAAQEVNQRFQNAWNEYEDTWIGMTHNPSLNDLPRRDRLEIERDIYNRIANDLRHEEGIDEKYGNGFHQ
jgi:hypothetical protein